MTSSYLCINRSCKTQKIAISETCCPQCHTPSHLNQRYYAIQELKQNPDFSSIVFEAIDTQRNNQSVILRVVYIDPHTIIPDHKTPPDEYFRREVEALSQLSERNIDGIPKVEKESDFRVEFPEDSPQFALCLPMEKIPGDNLEQYIKDHQPISEEKAISWMKRISTILRHLYLSGNDKTAYYHRDIKPSNIIRRPDDKLYLIDLGGVCKKTFNLYDSQNSTISKRTEFGTRNYSAPEQENKGVVNEKTELYALGKTFIFLLTGEEPFGNFPNIPVSEKFSDLLKSLTQCEPEKRPENIDEVLRKLQEIEQEYNDKKNIIKKPPNKQPFWRTLSNFITIKSIVWASLIGICILLWWTFGRGDNFQKPPPINGTNPFPVPSPSNPKTPTPPPSSPDLKCDERNTDERQISFSAMALDSKEHYQTRYKEKNFSQSLKNFPPDKFSFFQSSCTVNVTVKIDPTNESDWNENTKQSLEKIFMEGIKPKYREVVKFDWKEDR